MFNAGNSKSNKDIDEKIDKERDGNHGDNTLPRQAKPVGMKGVVEKNQRTKAKHISTRASLSTATAFKSIVKPRLRDDVLVGRGRLSSGGNKRFQDVVQFNAKRYRDANSRAEKSRIVYEIIGTIKAWGGRFLYRPKDCIGSGTRSGKRSTHEQLLFSSGNSSDSDQHSVTSWATADDIMVRKKVGQALRYQLEYLKYEEMVKDEESGKDSSNDEKASDSSPLSVSKPMTPNAEKTATFSNEKSESKGKTWKEVPVLLPPSYFQTSDSFKNKVASLAQEQCYNRQVEYNRDERDSNCANNIDGCEQNQIPTKSRSLTRQPTSASADTTPKVLTAENHNYESDDSWDELSVAAAMDIERSSFQHNADKNPILTNRQILTALGYDYDKVKVDDEENTNEEKRHIMDETMVRERNDVVQFDRKEEFRPLNGSSDLAQDLFEPMFSMYGKTDDDGSNSSFDISFDSFMELEQQEGNKRNSSNFNPQIDSQTAPLLNDAAILASLGYCNETEKWNFGENID